MRKGGGLVDAPGDWLDARRTNILIFQGKLCGTVVRASHRVHAAGCELWMPVAYGRGWSVPHNPRPLAPAVKRSGA